VALIVQPQQERGFVRATCLASVHNTVKDWHSEEEIKAQLRELTERTRKLRHDLDEMVRPGEPNPARAFIHRQMWPKAQPLPPAAAAERKRKPKKPR
jgi:hypothetical protein